MTTRARARREEGARCLLQCSFVLTATAACTTHTHARWARTDSEEAALLARLEKIAERRQAAGGGGGGTSGGTIGNGGSGSGGDQSMSLQEADFLRRKERGGGGVAHSASFADGALAAGGGAGPPWGGGLVPYEAGAPSYGGAFGLGAMEGGGGGGVGGGSDGADLKQRIAALVQVGGAFKGGLKRPSP